MKILCLIDTLGIGGAERQIIGLVSLLNNRGFKTELITYHQHEFENELNTRYGIHSIILNAGNSKLSKLRAIRKFIKESGGYDWIIAYKDGPCIIGCLLKILGGRFKLIVSERSNTIVLNKAKRIKFFLYNWANYVVPNSLTEAENIKLRFPKLSHKIVPITNFTDTDYFTPIQHQDKENRTILTTARLTKAKNIINYLKAIQVLKSRGFIHIHFDWYGNIQEGEEDYAHNCFKLREELNIEDLITFHPTKTNILPQYQECDLFCLPSIYEGFPNVICEAMSCGKPILCSNVCDMPHIVKESVNGILFDPTNVNEIADKLEKACQLTPKQIYEYGQQSRDTSVRLFSTDTFVNKYIQLLESI